MKKNSYTFFVSLLALIAILGGCVESIIDNEAGSPSITLYYPVSNDTVAIGENTVIYEAADHANGQGLSNYEIFVNDQAVATVPQNDDGSNPNLTFIVSEALIDSRISFYVNVYNEDGQVKQSNKQTNIYVSDNVPDAPGELTLTRLSEHSINLLWDDSSDNENSFELWRKVSSNGTYGDNPYKVLPPNTISTDDVGLSPTIEYYYKVRAVNETGYSGFSNEVSTSGSSTTLWNLHGYAIGSSGVQLIWTDFYPNELGFILERVNPIENVWERVDPLPLRNTTEYFDYNVSANTTYQYRITYYTNTTVGPWSNKAIITTYYTDGTPPQNLSYSSGRISWTIESDIEKGTWIEISEDGVSYEFLYETNEEATYYYHAVGIGDYIRARHKLAEKVYTEFSIYGPNTNP